jgi:hypothetical protein
MAIPNAPKADKCGATRWPRASLVDAYEKIATVDKILVPAERNV